MLNNPFCYSPSPAIVQASRELIARIDATPSLHALFAEGKMLGVLECAMPGSPSAVMPGLTGHLFLYAFSGLAGGSHFVEGFVPPIFAWSPEDIRSSSLEESRRLQEWLFERYVVLNGRGERKSIRQIFADRGLVPPGGTGDCAAPKLLQYALSHNLEPIAIGEFWYGAPPVREVRRHGAFYPACTGKCGPLLSYMMQGLDVEPNPLESDAHWEFSDPVVRYEDAGLIVAEKPAGMLAVPGRPVPGVEQRTSLQDWLSSYCGTPVFSCHRLDMDTSGLMVFAKSADSQRNMQQQFEKREVSKAYLAWISGEAAPGPPLLAPGDKGKISLPLAPDWYDRPRQMADREHGKPAVTEYEILSIRNPDGALFVRLIPYTGRTHQLRVHCAHPEGLGRPILGDRLYGGERLSLTAGTAWTAGIEEPAGISGPGRLMLHAAYLSFRHPADGRRLTFESEMPKS
ncbi:MAG: RluA family pseudouridine synthase [Bacteroidales bacterium]|nr:RluA family pseudouridine synthase [Bacteroidales bacterium]